jgi:hypothetical protein
VTISADRQSQPKLQSSAPMYLYNATMRSPPMQCSNEGSAEAGLTEVMPYDQYWIARDLRALQQLAHQSKPGCTQTKNAHDGSFGQYSNYSSVSN